MLEKLKTCVKHFLNQVAVNLDTNTFLVKLIRKLKTLLQYFLEPNEFRSKIFAQIPYSTKMQITLLDVGANVGQTTLKFNRILSSKCQFFAYCFEPFSENFEALKYNTSKFSNIKSFQLGVGDSNSILTVFLAPNSQWHSITNQQAWSSGSSQSETINVITLDSFVQEKNISSPIILKTDTEGYDLNVLKGAKKLLERKLIDIIICEVGFKLEDKQHSYYLHIFEYLKSFGYQIYLIEDQILYEGSMDNLYSLGYANVWFLSPSLSRSHS